MSQHRTYLVPFMIGDGTEPVMLTVIYWTPDMPRDVNHNCAFCHGDPCAEYSAPSTRIAQFFKRNGSWAETCPACQGRPT